MTAFYFTVTERSGIPAFISVWIECGRVVKIQEAEILPYEGHPVIFRNLAQFV